jgi:altronate hydrolase
MENPIIQLHPEDNVLVALEDIEAGRKILFNGKEIKIRHPVPAKHKFSLSVLNIGEKIIMYGVPVGKVVQKIHPGEPVTVQNTVHNTVEYSIGDRQLTWQAPEVTSWKNRSFEGYLRSDGRVGTANYWIVVPLVFCENRNVEVIQSALIESLGYARDKEFLIDIQPLIKGYQAGEVTDKILESTIIRSSEEVSRNRVFQQVDGIKFLTHEGGCGGTREDSETLSALLAGYITHPNVAGATVLSLGCQHAQIPMLREKIRKLDPSFSRPLVLAEQQKYPNEKAFISEAIKKTFAGLIEANKIERRPAPLSKLILGLECGGSDGFSGISANPVLGNVSDKVVALGGITILSEFPELNGVEQELLNRCVSREKAEKFALLMKKYSDRAEALGSGFDNNPSPGNIRDGLITHIMKSAGAAKKGGTSPVTDVLDYTDQAVTLGLNLLCTPGNDVESTTGLAGSGVNIILFTTGLGTPTGNPIAPVIKVSSNTTLYKRMNDIIDFDAGPVIQGKASIPEMGEQLLDYIVEVASGRKRTAAMLKEQNDFIPWKRGVSL